MPQGKLKVKAKLPASAKMKKSKGVTKKPNRPVPPKAKKTPETRKLKKVLLKTINESMEKELRSKALSGKQSLTSAKKSGTSGTSKKK